MATEQRIREKIAELNGRKNAVSVDELVWISNQLQGYMTVSIRKARHGTLFRFEHRIINICTHRPGDKHVKSCYIDEFLDAMSELGWYDD